MTNADETAREAAALHLCDEVIIRPESLAREVVDFLIREGHVVLSTAPADDVREALATEWLTSYHGSIDATALTLAFKAGYAAAEVRPRGTVTDAAVEAAWLAWDAVSVDDDPNGWLSIRAALEAARKARS